MKEELHWERVLWQESGGVIGKKCQNVGCRTVEFSTHVITTVKGTKKGIERIDLEKHFHFSINIEESKFKFQSIDMN